MEMIEEVIISDDPFCFNPNDDEEEPILAEDDPTLQSHQTTLEQDLEYCQQKFPQDEFKIRDGKIIRLICGRWNTVCQHGRKNPRRECKDCSPCPHGKPPVGCVQCNRCPHNLLRKGCGLCTGCEHGRKRRLCAMFTLRARKSKIILRGLCRMSSQEIQRKLQHLYSLPAR